VTAPLGLPEASDAELVALVLQADREAFATVYDRYGPRLYDFAYSMLRQREDAADAVADSFVRFAERLSQLRDPDRLRPWLYAIVRSECLRRLKARKRVSYGDDEQLAAMADDAMTPDEAAEKAALQNLVWDAAAGLADRDRALLDLHLRQGLEGAELGEAMGVTAANAYVMLNRLRAQVDRSQGALLIARLGRDDCDELDTLLKDWDGSFSPLIRKRVARHVEGCDICGERRKKILSPWMLLAGVPMFAAPAALRDRVVNDTQLVAYSGPPLSQSAGGGRWSRGRTAAAAAAVLVVVGGAVVLWPNGDDPKSADQPIGATSPAAPSTVPTLGTSGPSTDPSASATGTATSEPSASASATGTPGTLAVSSSTIDLGATRSVGSVVVRNTGDEPVDFLASTDDAWLQPALGTGTLAADESTQLTVTAERDALAEGRSTGVVLIQSANQNLQVTVTLTEEHPPFVGRPTAPDPSCTQQTVTASVQVIDESSLSRVTLTWSGPNGSGEALMTRAGSVWVARMGPFTTGGPVTFRVRATDSRGNTAISPAGSADATPCPG